MFLELTDNDIKVMHNLIEQIAARNESSLEKLYDLTHAKVYGLALKVTRRHDLAEEVVGDTYWQIWHEAAKFDLLRGQPMAWLMIICRSRALDILRKLDVAESHPDPAEIVPEDTEAIEETPLESLLRIERDSALHAALQGLSPIQKQLVAMAFFKDYTHQEIADNTKLPLGSVKSHIKRAQTQLKNALLLKEVQKC